MCVYIYIYIYIYTHTYTYIYIYTYLCTYIYIYRYVYVYRYRYRYKVSSLPDGTSKSLSGERSQRVVAHVQPWVDSHGAYCIIAYDNLVYYTIVYDLLLLFVYV